MNWAPDTRASLLVQLRDHGNHAAWDEFHTIYEPFLYRLAKKFGHQECDAREIVQNVLLAVIKNLDSFHHSKSNGSFRAWLATIVRNQTLNLLTREQRHRGLGGSGFARIVADVADTTLDIEATYDIEYKRQLFMHAADKIRAEVADKTWQAFYQTSIDGAKPEKVAIALNMPVGNVYVSRTRVMARLKAAVVELQRDGEETL